MEQPAMATGGDHGSLTHAARGQSGHYAGTARHGVPHADGSSADGDGPGPSRLRPVAAQGGRGPRAFRAEVGTARRSGAARSEEHTSELQSRGQLVWRLLLEKEKKVGWPACTA